MLLLHTQSDRAKAPFLVFRTPNLLYLTSQLSEVAFFLENEATPIFRAEKGDLGGVEAGYE